MCGRGGRVGGGTLPMNRLRTRWPAARRAGSGRARRRGAGTGRPGRL